MIQPVNPVWQSGNKYFWPHLKRVTAESTRRFGWFCIGVQLLTVIGCDMQGDRSDPYRHPPTTEPLTWVIPGTETDANGHIHRTYDVRDLIVSVPDFDAPPDLSLPIARSTKPARRPSQTPVAGPELMKEQRVDQLITQIMQRVAPESWTVANQIRELQGQLIVRQTAENHPKLVKFLDDMRAVKQLQITVEFRFLELDDTTFKGSAVLKALTNADSLKAAVSLLSAVQVNEILRGAVSQVTAPRVSLSNGQRAWVMVGTERAYTADLKQKVNPDNTVAWEPVIQTVTSGIMVDIHATASTDHKVITLDVRPQISQVERIDDVPFPKDKTQKIQQPVVVVHELKAIFNVPDGQTAVLTGLSATALRAALQSTSTTMPAAGSATRPANAVSGKSVLVLVKATTIPYKSGANK